MEEMQKAFNKTIIKLQNTSRMAEEQVSKFNSIILLLFCFIIYLMEVGLWNRIYGIKHYGTCCKMNIVNDAAQQKGGAVKGIKRQASS